MEKKETITNNQRAKKTMENFYFTNEKQRIVGEGKEENDSRQEKQMKGTVKY